ncbi:hypothetical protein OPQ81_011747 [Rhizoctonia solani]|nr:hypothetical protein OPQ81_011747 [Rhizoctonia solani]
MVMAKKETDTRETYSQSTITGAHCQLAKHTANRLDLRLANSILYRLFGQVVVGNSEAINIGLDIEEQEQDPRDCSLTTIDAPKMA